MQIKSKKKALFNLQSACSVYQQWRNLTCFQWINFVKSGKLFWKALICISLILPISHWLRKHIKKIITKTVCLHYIKSTMLHLNSEIAYSNVVLTLSNKAMYRENPNWSRRPIFSDNCWQSSLAVVAESANSVFVFPSIKVIGSMRGFLDLVACNSSQLGGWFRVPFAKVLLNLSSQ